MKYLSYYFESEVTLVVSATREEWDADPTKLTAIIKQLQDNDVQIIGIKKIQTDVDAISDTVSVSVKLQVVSFNSIVSRLEQLLREKILEINSLRIRSISSTELTAIREINLVSRINYWKLNEYVVEIPEVTEPDLDSEEVK